MHYNQGNRALLDALEIWGIHTVYGVIGGGIFELIKDLPFYSSQKKRKLQYFTLSEYAAGFAPIGSYLATGEISACLSIPGAAIKLMGPGMSDAKVQRIPALYLVCLNYSSMLEKTPLQDVGPYGMNICEQLIAEFGNDAIYMNELKIFPECIDRIFTILSAKRPAVFMFHPDHLSQPIELSHISCLTHSHRLISNEVNQFVDFVEASIKARKQIYL